MRVDMQINGVLEAWKQRRLYRDELEAEIERLQRENRELRAQLESRDEAKNESIR